MIFAKDRRFTGKRKGRSRKGLIWGKKDLLT